MVKIAICDDEKKYLDTSAAFLLEYAALRNVRFSAEQFDTPSDLLDTLDKGEHYDIYFLDVYMPGVTGVSVATELRRRNDESPIIFLTSSRDHAVEAFGVGATHYLLKPYTKDDFFAAMDKAMRSIGQDKPKTVLMKTANGYYNIPVGNIIYCESANHNQTIYFAEGEPASVRISQAELWEKLSPFGQFYLCGKTFIINLEQIEKILSDTVEMTTGKCLAVPRRAMASLKNAYMDYLGMR
ncbi:MAG: response regulator transcription factor [Oscillospiraceae bacterium]|nr:response regulator transcription factor [Oscillospiraceae bacterium]